MKFFWMIGLNILIVAGGATKGCLFSTEEINEIKNEVKDFLKGLQVGNEKIDKAVGLVSKAQSLSEQGHSDKQIQILMSTDVVQTAKDLGVEEVQVVQEITKIVKNKGPSSSIHSVTSTPISCPANLSTQSSNVENKEGAKIFLSNIPDNQLACISGNLMSIINVQAVKEHVAMRSNTHQFVNLVKTQKVNLLNLLNDELNQHKTSLEMTKIALSQIWRNLESVIGNIEPIKKEFGKLSNNCWITERRSGDSNASAKQRNMESNVDKMNSYGREYSSNLQKLSTNVNYLVEAKAKLRISIELNLISELNSIVKELNKFAIYINSSINPGLSECASRIAKERSEFPFDQFHKLDTLYKKSFKEINTSNNRSSELDIFLHEEIKTLEKSIMSSIENLEARIKILQDDISTLQRIITN